MTDSKQDPGMRYRTLGSSGLMVSVVGLGTNNVGRRLDLDATQALVDEALDVGINLFDTADVYGGGASETLLGEVLKGRRDDVVIATKFGSPLDGENGENHGARGSRRYIRRAIEGSLQRLQTDRVDLYQYHSPDGITPFEETLAALDELIREGKVLYAGSSNLDAWQVTDADWTARRDGSSARFVSAQNEYSLLERGVEAELSPACERFGIGILPYFPLGSGLLTGKYRRGRPRPTGTRLEGRDSVFTEDRFDRIEALAAFAEARGVTMLDAAIGGLAAQPAVASVIAGAMTPEQVRANAVGGAWVPSGDDQEELDRIMPTARRR